MGAKAKQKRATRDEVNRAETAANAWKQIAQEHDAMLNHCETALAAISDMKQASEARRAAAEMLRLIDNHRCPF